MDKITGLCFVLAGIGTAGLLWPAAGPEVDTSAWTVIPIVPSEQPSRTTVVADAIQLTSKLDGSATAKNHGPSVSLFVPGRAVDVEPPAVTLNSPAVAHNETAQKLANDIQIELRRVGCYDGELSGTWDSKTRRATKMFLLHLNATLPTDHPDYVLRVMLKGFQGTACGKTSSPLSQNASAGKVIDEPGVASQVLATSMSDISAVRGLNAPTSLDSQLRMSVGGPVQLRPVTPPSQQASVPVDSKQVVVGQNENLRLEATRAERPQTHEPRKEAARESAVPREERVTSKAGMNFRTPEGVKSFWANRGG